MRASELDDYQKQIALASRQFAKNTNKSIDYYEARNSTTTPLRSKPGGILRVPSATSGDPIRPTKEKFESPASGYDAASDLNLPQNAAKWKQMQEERQQAAKSKIDKIPTIDGKPIVEMYISEVGYVPMTHGEAGVAKEISQSYVANTTQKQVTFGRTISEPEPDLSCMHSSHSITRDRSGRLTVPSARCGQRKTGRHSFSQHDAVHFLRHPKVKTIRRSQSLQIGHNVDDRRSRYSGSLPNVSRRPQHCHPDSELEKEDVSAEFNSNSAHRLPANVHADHAVPQQTCENPALNDDYTSKYDRLQAAWERVSSNLLQENRHHHGNSVAVSRASRNYPETNDYERQHQLAHEITQQLQAMRVSVPATQLSSTNDSEEYQHLLTQAITQQLQALRPEQGSFEPPYSREDVVKNKITRSSEVLEEERYPIDLDGRKDVFLPKYQPPLPIMRVGRVWQPPPEPDHRIPSPKDRKPPQAEVDDKSHIWLPCLTEPPYRVERKNFTPQNSPPSHFKIPPSPQAFVSNRHSVYLAEPNSEMLSAAGCGDYAASQNSGRVGPFEVSHHITTHILNRFGSASAFPTRPFPLIRQGLDCPEPLNPRNHSESEAFPSPPSIDFMDRRHDLSSARTPAVGDTRHGLMASPSSTNSSTRFRQYIPVSDVSRACIHKHTIQGPQQNACSCSCCSPANVEIYDGRSTSVASDQHFSSLEYMTLGNIPTERHPSTVTGLDVPNSVNIRNRIQVYEQPPDISVELRCSPAPRETSGQGTRIPVQPVQAAQTPSSSSRSIPLVSSRNNRVGKTHPSQQRVSVVYSPLSAADSIRSSSHQGETSASSISLDESLRTSKQRHLGGSVLHQAAATTKSKGRPHRTVVLHEQDAKSSAAGRRTSSRSRTHSSMKMTKVTALPSEP